LPTQFVMQMDDTIERPGGSLGWRGRWQVTARLQLGEQRLHACAQLLQSRSVRL
jgi:hypothetical protein